MHYFLTIVDGLAWSAQNVTSRMKSSIYSTTVTSQNKQLMIGKPAWTAQNKKLARAGNNGNTA